MRNGPLIRVPGLPQRCDSVRLLKTPESVVSSGTNYMKQGRASDQHSGWQVLSMLMDDHIVNVWSAFVGNFVADSRRTTLRFTSVTPSTGTVGNFLDAISVNGRDTVTVSEPGAHFLLGGGLLGLGLRRRAQKRAS